MLVSPLTRLISSPHPSLNLSHPTLESFIWNTLIRAHVQGKARPTTPTTHAPVTIFLRMRFHGVDPDFHTFPFLLQSFTSPSHLHAAQSIHAQVLRFGLDTDPFVQSSLINVYSSCGNVGFSQQVFDEINQPDLPSWNSIINASAKLGLVQIARNLFDKMPERNVVSWSCMMDGYLRCGDCKEALALFREMQKLDGRDVRPNEFTMSVVLSACGRLSALEHGKWAHAYVDKCGLEVDVILGTSLIDMYGKCGRIEEGLCVFQSMEEKNVFTWNALIKGLALAKSGEEAVWWFFQMEQRGIKPDEVTLIGVLCACSHSGLVQVGESIFRSLVDGKYGFAPGIKHYSCVVDLFARSGHLEEALKIIKEMPFEPTKPVWGTLLAGSRAHGDLEMSEFAAWKLIELQPENSGYYVILANIYSLMGRWIDAEKVWELMKERGLKKDLGCSSVELQPLYSVNELVA